jgi:FkbM family methyltransferase
MVKLVHGAWLPDRENYLARDIANSPRFAGGPSVQLKKFLRALPLCRQCRHAVDIGSNVGLWTRVMAACFDRVTSFEPNPECHEAFWLNNPSTMGIDSRITLHPVALGREAATVALNTRLKSTAFSRVDAAGDVIAEQRTLDSFGLMEVDLIKIDVEGWEHNVVKGAAETITRCHPVMIVEQKPGNAELHGLKQFGAVNLLKKWGAVEVADMAGDIIMAWP